MTNIDEGLVLDELTQAFKFRTTAYAEQTPQGSYIKRDAQLTKRDLKAHLAGDKTIASYLISPVTNNAYLGLLDFDRSNDDLLPAQKHQVKSCLIACEELGLKKSIALENSGSKGYHLWLMTEEPLPARDIRGILQAIVDKASLEPVRGCNIEVIPKMDSVGASDYGSCAKLPLGVHQKSGKRSTFLDDALEPIDPFTALTKISKLDLSTAARILKDRKPGPELEIKTETKADNRMLPCLAALMTGISQGERNEAAFILAKMHGRNGLTGDMALAALSAWNKDCKPPLDDRELEKIVSSAFSKGYSGIGCESVVLSSRCNPDCPVKKTKDEPVKEAETDIPKMISREAKAFLEYEYPAQQFICEPFLIHQGKAFLSGWSGHKKSWLAAQLALCIATGTDFLGFHITAPEKVLLVNAEITASHLQNRLRTMMSNIDYKTDMLHIINPEDIVRSGGLFLDDVKGRERLIEAIMAVDAKVVILDPLSRLHNSPENDNSIINSMLSEVNGIIIKTGASLVIAHHWRKPSEGSGRSTHLRGAISFRDWCDSEICIETKQSKNGQKYSRLEFNKIRYGQDIDGLSLDFDVDRFWFDILEDFETEGKVIKAYDIVAYLMDKPNNEERRSALVEDLCKAFNVSKRTIDRVILEAKAGQMIEAIQLNEQYNPILLRLKDREIF